MTAVRYGHTSRRADQIPPGDLICPPRGPIRRVAQTEHWTRWDGCQMVTLVDVNGRGFAAREAGWLYRVEHQIGAN